MPLPRVRFTVRRMMVVVAIVALLLGGVAWLFREVNRGLWEFYRPGGTLDRNHQPIKEPR